MSKDQLAQIRIEAMWKGIDATAVWLNCPTLSVEEGRELGVDWSVVSERSKRFFKDEKKVRAWAVAGKFMRMPDFLYLPPKAGFSWRGPARR